MLYPVSHEPKLKEEVHVVILDVEHSFLLEKATIRVVIRGER